MFLDEELVQIELRRNTKPEENEERDKIKKDILRQEKEQKPIPDLINELTSGKIIIDEIEYPCEKVSYFENRSNLYICSDDVEKTIQNVQGLTVIYKTLEIGINLTFMKAPLAIKNVREYQKKLSAHMKQSNVPYIPMDTDTLYSGETLISYATGITTSSVGGIYIIHFYYKNKGAVISGNYTCRLLRRYSFEHLFLAMLHLICKEEN